VTALNGISGEISAVVKLSTLRERNTSGKAEFETGLRLASSRRRSDWRLAIDHWMAAAREGNARAMFYLGVAFDRGRGVARDAARARQWYRRAAVLNHAEAAYNLALLYRDGVGVRRSAASAEKWLRIAASQRDRDAARDLGVLILGHDSVSEERAREAVYWYRKASGAGDAKATFNLGLCYVDGLGVRRNVRRGRELIARAKRAGLPAAKRFLDTPRDS
jgi:uncharacterized protein